MSSITEQSNTNLVLIASFLARILTSACCYPYMQIGQIVFLPGAGKLRQLSYVREYVSKLLWNIIFALFELIYPKIQLSLFYISRRMSEEPELFNWSRILSLFMLSNSLQLSALIGLFPPLNLSAIEQLDIHQQCSELIGLSLSFQFLIPCLCHPLNFC